MFFAFVGCSAGEPVRPGDAAVDPDSDAAAANDAESPSESVTALIPAATAVPGPTIDDESLAEFVQLAAGQQAEDSQGNLIAVYGVAAWPDSIEALPDGAQASYPFFGDVDELSDPATHLLALDVGMCAAGIDASSFGTAEFFVHAASTEVLSNDPVRDRSMLTRHPVVQPGFHFPGAATCDRGWLPILWSGEGFPTVARYLLTTRASASAEVEQHLYQWELAPLTAPVAAPADGAAANELFAVGSTVTFTDGRLNGVTVQVEGWAELVGRASAIEGTRLVGVWATWCASTTAPQFGLAIDGWNVVAPNPAEIAPPADRRDAIADASGCTADWLEFTVPFGAEATGFFASDGVNPQAGYAEWTLDGAALPAPE